MTTDGIRPQEAQEKFLSTSADIAIFGGAAGGGKSFALLVEPLRHLNNSNFNAVIFRRKMTEIRNPDGLWDESEKIYAQLGAFPQISVRKWKFPSGGTVQFWHMEHDKNRYDWMGAQIAYLGFDELTHFSEKQFWYMLSRNRTLCGVKPYIRATCNPNPDSFVANLVAWYIDPETGYAIPERSGALRYFVRRGNKLEWADSKQELVDAFEDVMEAEVKSFTFIPASVYDNKILLERDPAYLGNLKALSYVDRARLLDGNWFIRESAGTMFRRDWFEIVDAIPAALVQTLRYWDRAATAETGTNDPDYSVGCKACMDEHRTIYITDISRFRKTAGGVLKSMKALASQDGYDTSIWFEQDPGQAGKVEAWHLTTDFAGYETHRKLASGSKIVRAKPFSAQAEVGNVKLLRGSWNQAFLTELDMFPDGAHDDQVDAASGVVNALLTRVEPMITFL